MFSLLAQLHIFSRFLAIEELFHFLKVLSGQIDFLLALTVHLHGNCELLFERIHFFTTDFQIISQLFFLVLQNVDLLKESELFLLEGFNLLFKEVVAFLLALNNVFHFSNVLFLLG
jgi:hypothetical protein